MDARRGSDTPKSRTSMELKGDREIIISRLFRAPPRLVFDAWTRADLVKRWWAPQSNCVEIVDVQADVRVGGKYRYQLQQDGNPIVFSGKYVEITPPSRLVYTQVFEMFPDAEMVITVDFAERDGMTMMTSHERYPTPEARAGALAAGMEHGMLQTMDQLDDLVVSLL